MDLSQSRTQYENIDFTLVVSTGEQVIAEFTTLRDLVHIDLDLDELTVDATIEIFEKTDGGNYVLVTTALFPDDFNDNVLVVGAELDGGGQDIKLTITTPIAEAMSRTIPYSLEVTTRP